MTDEGKVTISIKGAEFVVSQDDARITSQLRVGDRVKVLTKTYSDHAIHAGVVLGFLPFKELPSIEIAYIEKSYSGADLKFLTFNNETKDTEVLRISDEEEDLLLLDRDLVHKHFTRERHKHELAISELHDKEEYFRKHFAVYWEQITVPAETTEQE
jgi:hypothetical protein